MMTIKDIVFNTLCKHKSEDFAHNSIDYIFDSQSTDNFLVFERIEMLLSKEKMSYKYVCKFIQEVVELIVK